MENYELDKILNYEEFKEYFNNFSYEAEIIIVINGEEYMIIKINNNINSVSFQKMGDQRGEIYYKSLDDLYESETIFGICLKRDWKKISRITNYW